MQRFSGMPFDVALFDLIAPYLLLGKNLGPIHAALSVLAVDSYQEGIAEGGVVVRGIAHFHGDAGGFFDPANGTFGANAANTEGHPKDDPGRRDPWFDIRDTHVDFNLVARRHASQIVATGAAGLPAATAGVLSALDPPPGPDPSDYPNTEFTLDLVLTSVVLRPPFLVGAKLRPDGLLEPDADHKSVTFTLPKVKLRLAQGSTVGSQLTLDLVSLGASGLDDPGDLGVVDFVTMDPPYAFVGDSRVVGFGFRSAVLDLSDGATPPDVLSQFGFDESWQGLYLPEIRLFIAPHGMQDIAVDAGARNLLIGFGASAGITGDFELDVIQQGAGPLHLGARFYDATGRAFGITPAGDGHANASLPEHTRMVVDINGGRTPYTCSVSIDGGGAQAGRVFDIDLSAAATRTVAITAGGGGAGQSGSLSIAVSRRPPPTLTTGG
ncbi:MAG: hypothetical protein M3N98_01605, partial [Actinomycetota bacterium]|nr:hypothetical protein [Actinomycetota bacterium]